MTQSPDTYKASFSYMNHKKAKLNLPELAALVGADTADITKDTDSGSDVLWEGFFSFLEGPSVARYHIKTEQLAFGALQARNRKSSTSFMGIPIRQQEHAASITYDQPGKLITALSAYAAKLDDGALHGTTIRLPYSGPDIRVSGASSVRNPYGVPDVGATLIPSRQSYTNPEQQDGLFFLGTMAISSERPHDLPAVMLGQLAVINKITSEHIGQSVVETVYGGDITTVSYAWYGAMAKPTPQQAAEHILTELPG